MSRGLFGWSYPPGCNSVPGDDPSFCLTCGNECDDCICPECPECGEYGNPACYEKHGLVLNDEQKAAKAKADKAAQDEAEAMARLEANAPPEEDWKG